jgi:hypothetical protein
MVNLTFYVSDPRFGTNADYVRYFRNAQTRYETGDVSVNWELNIGCMIYLNQKSGD